MTVFESAAPVCGFAPGAVRGRGDHDRSGAQPHRRLPQRVTVAAHGLDPTGTPRQLATVELSFPPAEAEATSALSLPAELRNRVTRFEMRACARPARSVPDRRQSAAARDRASLAGRDEREGLRSAVADPLSGARAVAERRSDRRGDIGHRAGQSRRDHTGRRGDAGGNRAAGAGGLGAQGRPAVALCRSAPCGVRHGARGRRCADAGASARGRAHRGRRDELGRTQGVARVFVRKPVLRAGVPPTMSPFPVRSWRSPTRHWPNAPSPRWPMARRW